MRQRGQRRFGWTHASTAQAVPRGRGLRESAGGSGGSERNVPCDSASACGAALERELWTAGVPVPVPNPEPASVLGLALSGAGLHGSSGRLDGKNRRGGTPVVFGERRDDVVTGAVEPSASGSALGPALLPSGPDERRREVKSVKSTVRDWAGRRRMDGWRVSAASGGADAAAVGDAGAHPSGDMWFRRGWGTIQDKTKIGRKIGRTRAGVGVRIG
jgi:hypothetical protein